jgi:hypothetical protein
MCLIAVKKCGANLPKDEHLLEAEIRNKDGIGVAFWKPGTSEVVIKKDFKDSLELIVWLKCNIHQEDACIIHFRFATHGLIDMGNRHPFPITKNTELLRKTSLVCQSAMAHNGTIDGYEHKKFSDTQKFVLDILSDETVKNNLENDAVRKLLSGFLGGDRMSILKNDGTIYLFGNWITEGDIVYSNSGYKPYIAPVYNYSSSYQGNFGRPTSKNSEIYVDVCDGCNKNKSLKFIFLDEADDTGVALCKSCRKQYKKGKLKIGEYSGIKSEQKSEKIVHDFLYDDLDGNLGQKQCEGCHTIVNRQDLYNYYGFKICKECLGGIPHDISAKVGKVLYIAPKDDEDL